MKKPLSLNAFALSTLVTLSLLSAHRAQAAAITWNSPLTIAGDTDVSTLGTPVFAYDWNGAAGNTTVNGVTFTGTTTINGTVAGDLHTGGGWIANQTAIYITGTAAPATALTTAYKNILDGGPYGAGSTPTMTIYNLTIGRQYQIQVWVNDSRSFGATRAESLSTPGGNTVTLNFLQNVLGSLGQYCLGTFTADATSQTFTITPADGNIYPQINAIQLRRLPVAAAPAFSPPAGEYPGAPTVTLTSDTGSTIFYTTNNTVPTSSSPSGASPLTLVVPVNVTMTIQAYATNSGSADSPTASATYTTVPAASGTWTSATGGSWINAGNWSGNVIAGGAGFTADFSTLSLLSDAVVSLDAPAWPIGNLLFDDRSGAGYSWMVNAGSGGVLTLAASSGTPVLSNNSPVTINAVLAGGNALRKTGDGTLTLTALNTYTGGTVVNRGVLSLGSGGATGIIQGALTINEGTEVDPGAGWALGYGLGSACVSNITINGGTLNFTGAARSGGTAATNITMTGGAIGGSLFDWYNGIGNTPSLTTLPSSTTAVLSSGIALRLQYLTNHLTFNVAQGPIPGQADLWVSGDIIAGGYGNHGGILKTGAGLMELSGTDSVDGGTTVIDGTLLVDGSAVVTTPVTVQGAGTLDLAGTINAPVTVSAGGLLRGTGTIRGALTNDSGGTLAPGQSSIGTLNLAGTLTLDAGSTNVMRINKTGSTLTADLVNLTGTSGVAYSGTLRILASPGSDALAPGDKFILFAKSAGAFTGSFGALDLPALGAGMVWYTGDLTTDGSIAVLSTSAVATPTFDPPAGSYVGAQAVSIRCGTAGATIHYTIDNTTPNTSSPVYSNAIVVPASATMTIQALATKPGYADSAVGSASYLTQPAAIWTSLFGGSWTQAGNWTNNILANGRGVPALFNTLTLVGDAIVTLDSPPTVGYLAFGDVGSNYNWQVNAGTGGPLILDAATSPTLQVDNQTATITAVLAGTNGLIKTGGGTLALTAINTYNGGTVVSNGTLTLGGAGSSGVIRGALTINSGAQVEADTGWALGFGLGSACVTNIIIDGGTLNFTGAAPPAGGGTSATNITIVGGTLSGTQFHWYQGLTTSPSLTTLPSSTTAVLSSGIAIRLQYPSNNITFDVARGTTASGVDLLVSGDISPGGWGNHGGILKAGVGVLVLAGTDSCDGGTTVSGGTLLVDSAGVVSTPVTVQGGTLAGNGTINAPVTVNAGGTLAPGGSLAIGTLLISSPLTLNVGSTTMARLDKAAAINDSVSGIGTLTYGGTLTVTNLAGTLAEGDAFQVFSAAANSGNFAAMNLPALGAGLAWSWTPENGTLTVVKAAIPPVLSGYGPLSGSSFPLTFSGPSGQTYKVLMSTNVALPLPSWTVLTSDTFGASPVTYTDTGATNVHRFYRITSP